MLRNTTHWHWDGEVRFRIIRALTTGNCHGQGPVKTQEFGRPADFVASKGAMKSERGYCRTLREQGPIILIPTRLESMV